MSIKFSEEILPLSEAARRLPRRRRGRQVAVSTLYRWATVGIRGIRLEVIQIGGTKCTSQQALERFFDQLTNLGNAASQPPAEAYRRDAETERQLQNVFGDDGVPANR
jgi:hypothetical protein